MTDANASCSAFPIIGYKQREMALNTSSRCHWKGLQDIGCPNYPTLTGEVNQAWRRFLPFSWNSFPINRLSFVCRSIRASRIISACCERKQMSCHASALRSKRSPGQRSSIVIGCRIAEWITRKRSARKMGLAPYSRWSQLTSYRTKKLQDVGSRKFGVNLNKHTRWTTTRHSTTVQII